MNDPQRLKRIAETVLAQTEAGELDWQSVGESEAHFVTELGDIPVGIWSEDKDDSAPFRFSIGNQDRREIAYLSSVVGATGTEEMAINQLLYKLYRQVKGRALGIDDVLVDVERRLGLG